MVVRLLLLETRNILKICHWRSPLQRPSVLPVLKIQRIWHIFKRRGQVTLFLLHHPIKGIWDTCLQLTITNCFSSSRKSTPQPSTDLTLALSRCTIFFRHSDPPTRIHLQGNLYFSSRHATAIRKPVSFQTKATTPQRQVWRRCRSRLRLFTVLVQKDGPYLSGGVPEVSQKPRNFWKEANLKLMSIDTAFLNASLGRQENRLFKTAVKIVFSTHRI